MTNYTRGRTAEYQAKKELEKQGYYVVRSSGSHSCIDIIAIGVNIKLIQIKRTKRALTINFVNGLYDKDINALRELHVSTNVSKELWVWLDRKGWDKYNIKGA
jgi:hypothetical protein